MVDGNQAFNQTQSNLSQLMQSQLALVELPIGQSSVGQIFHKPLDSGWRRFH
jgi:hypothetical protein